MAYTNTTQNEKRYRELCSRYESKMRVRSARIEQKRADLEAEKKALQDINDELQILSASGGISYETAKERNRLHSERTRALQRVQDAETALKAEEVGEDNLQMLDQIFGSKVIRHY